MVQLDPSPLLPTNNRYVFQLDSSSLNGNLLWGYEWIVQVDTMAQGVLQVSIQ